MGSYVNSVTRGSNSFQISVATVSHAHRPNNGRVVFKAGKPGGQLTGTAASSEPSSASVHVLRPLWSARWAQERPGTHPQELGPNKKQKGYLIVKKIGPLGRLPEGLRQRVQGALSFLLSLSLSCSLPLIFQILCPGFPSPAHLPQSLLVFFLPSSYSCFLSQLMSHFLRELSLTPDFDLFSVLKHVSFGSTNHHFIEIIFVL